MVLPISMAMSLWLIYLFILVMGVVLVAVTLWDCDWRDPDR